MKKLISLLMAMLFLLGTVTVVNAEGEPFKGVVIDETDLSMTVMNEFGTLLTFVPDNGVELPALGSTVTVEYTGDITSVLVASAITVDAEPATVTASGTVASVNENGFAVTLDDGTTAEFRITGATTVGGKTNKLAEGQTVTVAYIESVYSKVAQDVKITAEAVKTVEVNPDDTLNRTLSGTVTKLSSSKIVIKTKKGKTWTFKRTNKTKVSGKYDLKVGATVVVTYDGFASSKPLAKKVKVTKAAPDKQYKTVKGTCSYFGGMAIGLTNGFEADVAYAKHSGDGDRDAGTKVKVTYYTKNGCNYATKIKWY